jgi:flavin-dependent dehydrogenase
MENSRSYDVVVVGGGPGGAAASKRCAEYGLKTLMIEKRALPRDKVCTGMIMGDWSINSIREEFGEIPESVFVTPPKLSGHQLHVAGTEVQTLEWPTWIGWRKDFDFWLVNRARESGVTIEDAARVDHVVAEENYYHVITQRRGNTEGIRARFVIGADGATSVVRRSMFPDLEVRYSGPVRECYSGALNLDTNFIHWFFPRGLPRPRFNVNQKNDVFLIEGAGIRELGAEIIETLLPYGFTSESKPIWKDGCAIALLHEPLLSGAFQPAKDNILLVGDAAGLILPLTFEGIGSALRSGVLAAEAIIKSTDDKKIAAPAYIQSIGGIVKAIRHLCSIQDKLKEKKDARALAVFLLAAYRETLTIQQSLGESQFPNLPSAL